MNQNDIRIERPAHRRHARGGFKKFTGTLLVATGLFWLAHKAGWIPVAAGEPSLFWPAATIALGVVMLWGSGRRRIHHGS
jgi:hypothetical protein